MRKSQYSDEQIVGIIRESQAHGVAVVRHTKHHLQHVNGD
jgi:hypothetical protein